MEGIRIEFCHTGRYQKVPDIIIDLKRCEKKEIDKWTPEQRRAASDWLKQAERAWQNFKREILE